MSTVYRRLRGAFRAPRASVPSTPKATTASERNDNRKSKMKYLFKERKLRTLVEKFKQSSETSWFRARHAIYFDTVRRLASAKKYSWIEEILEAQKKYKNITEEGFAIRLMILYGKAGMFDHAHKLFDEMPQLNCERTVRSFNALLAACVDSVKFDKVEEIFRELPQKLSINPDEVSYNTLVKAFCGKGSLDSALSMIDEMERNGLGPNLITFNTLLDAFYQSSRFSDGENVWALMESKSIAPCIKSYNARLRGLVSEKRMPEAVELIEELRTKGPQTDVFSFNALIKGFCDDGNLEEGMKWYRELMKNDDCAPNRMTFAALVPAVCEAGDFDLALELCNEAITSSSGADVTLFRPVVDGLVKESKVEEATMLVKLMKQNGYSRCKFNLPSDSGLVESKVEEATELVSEASLNLPSDK